MLYLFPFGPLRPDQKDIVLLTRSKKEHKIRFCFAISAFLALCLGCMLDAFVLFQFQAEMSSYSEEDHYFQEEFVFLLRGDSQRHSHRQNARKRERIKEAAATDDQSIHIQVPPFSPEESFAGCLLFLDQNHRMTEWIAYHYFALPLRTLFIAYDPKTRDRAKELIARWKHVISIVEWNDDDFLPANWTDGLVPDQKRKASLATVAHRKRQLLFHQKCHEHSVEMGIQRTLLVDPDEYLRINPEVIPSTVVNTNEPGHITQLLKQLEAPNNKLLEEQDGVTYNANCSIYPRVQFTTLGPNQLYKVPKDVLYDEPGLVDPFYFNTLRYRYRNRHRMKHPKAVVDARNGVPHQITNLHYPLDLKCNKTAYSLDKSPLLINHYIGSFGDFLHAFHSDARNDALNYADLISKYEARSRGLGNDHAFDFHVLNPLVRDDSIASWVPAFFAWQSEKVAQALLHDTGIRALDLNL